MELTRTDSVARGDTLTAYDFAMDEVTGASSKLAHALLACTLKRADVATVEQEYSNARSVRRPPAFSSAGLWSRPAL